MSKWTRQTNAANVYGNTPEGAMQFALAQGMNPLLASRAIANLFGSSSMRGSVPTASGYGKSSGTPNRVYASHQGPIHSSDVGYSADPLQDMIDLYSEVARTAGPPTLGPQPRDPGYGQWKREGGYTPAMIGGLGMTTWRT